MTEQFDPRHYDRDDHDIDNLTDAKGYDFGKLVEDARHTTDVKYREHPETGERRRVVARGRDMQPDEWLASREVHLDIHEDRPAVGSPTFQAFTLGAGSTMFQLLGEDPYRTSAVITCVSQTCLIGTRNALSGGQGFMLSVNVPITTHSTQAIWCVRSGSNDAQVSVWVERNGG